jgi:pimeloyl-ACP methyl ester carboxylesterase
METEPITGVAAGVPFLAVPPTGDRESAPVVVAWHLMDPPRTEVAFAAAVPLNGLDAWRFYLGLPMSGSRSPAGGVDEVMRLGYEDAVLNLYEPVTVQAAEEFGPAFVELRDRFGCAPGPLGLLGGSHGSAVAQLVIAEQDADVAAAVLVSPVCELYSVVQAVATRFGFTYPWTDRSREVARRLDFVSRADEVTARNPAVLLLVGEDDDVSGFREPATRMRSALAERLVPPDRAELALVPGMAHTFADEPGVEAAPQVPAAAEVDRLAAAWLGRHLTP